MEEEANNKTTNQEIGMFDLLKEIEGPEDSELYNSIKNITIKTIKHIESLYKNKENDPNYIDTDFSPLRFHRGDLIILAARPSIGKTAFALTLGNQIALNKNIPVGYISLGYSDDYFDDFFLGARFISINSDVPVQKIRHGMLKPSDIPKIQEAAKNLFDASIYLMNEPNSSFETLEWKTKILIEERKVQIIFINGFELFEELVDSEKDEYRINLESILGKLKKFAIEQHIPVIVELELPPAEEDNEPSLRDFKKYMIIPYLADMVLLLHRDRLREDDEKQDCKLKIVKNINSWAGDIPMIFNHKTSKFERYHN
ncbi:Replicative DNA helicase [Treponema sp. JC4]|uniref:DnaB-like helicase C-terminal domain-containing protein n=1 Tax=Treponema sp. JC4 TaxID=1124982 RepID=UPI00025B0CCA|nr:DnaB-like helicase C-terminal domain-containing protein [Treponema sp. JC4]EID84126.1 Replicative DNA helicase [Treponema sp. JC4]